MSGRPGLTQKSSLELSPLLHIGFDVYVVASQIVSIQPASHKAAENVIRSRKEKGPSAVIDATRGKARRTLLVLQSGHIAISCLSARQLCKRWNALEGVSEPEA